MAFKNTNHFDMINDAIKILSLQKWRVKQGWHCLGYTSDDTILNGLAPGAILLASDGNTNPNII
ncbi:MAG TPA: hypothetical protein VFY83_12825, partial [Anaerolineales bacterium]|nr:hypothetical protein [Anaerolineales bacterium]